MTSALQAVELFCPGRSALREGVAHVVGEEPGSEDQDSFVTERRERAAELEEPPGLEARERDLEHRYVGFGIHVRGAVRMRRGRARAEDDPHARRPSFASSARHAVRELGSAGGRVIAFDSSAPGSRKSRRGEAPSLSRRSRVGDRPSCAEEHQHGARFRHRFCPSAELFYQASSSTRIGAPWAAKMTGIFSRSWSWLP